MHFMIRTELLSSTITGGQLYTPSHPNAVHIWPSFDEDATQSQKERGEVNGQSGKKTAASDRHLGSMQWLRCRLSGRMGTVRVFP